MANRKPIFICAGFVALVTLVVMVSLVSIPKQNKSKQVSTKSDKPAPAPNNSNKEKVTGTTESSGNPKKPGTIPTKKPADFEENVDHRKDLDFIMKGIRKIEVHNTTIPGLMTVYGKNSFPILAREFDSTIRPIASAGRYGKGRFAAFSHSTLFIHKDPSEFDNDQLLRNVVNWTVSLKGRAHIGMCVNIQDVPRYQRVLYQQEFVTYSDIEDCWDQKLENITYLKGYDLLLLNNHRVMNNESQAIRQFVASGGGLILGSTPWSHNSDADYEFFADKILNLIGGAAFATDNFHFVQSGELNLTRSYLNDTNAYQVWIDFKNILHDNQSVEGELRLRQIKNILIDRIRFAPMDKNFSREMVEEFQYLVNTNRTFATITLTDPVLWANFKKVLHSIKSGPKENSAKSIDEVENIIHTNSTVYFNILKDMVTEFDLFVRNRL